MDSDVQELEIVHASEVHARRLSAKVVLMPESCDSFVFPVADGSAKMAARDQVSRTSSSMQYHLSQGEDHNDVLHGELDGYQPPDQQTDDIETRDGSWILSGDPI